MKKTETIESSTQQIENKFDKQPENYNLNDDQVKNLQK